MRTYGLEKTLASLKEGARAGGQGRNRQRADGNRQRSEKMKNEVIEKVIGAMKDTDDPIVGAVFEKTVEVDFSAFCAFVLSQWDNVTMEVHEDGLSAAAAKSTVYLFYNGPKSTDHVASYIIADWKKPHGVFGGSRVGSQNTAWNDTGVSFVESPFQLRGAA